MSQELATVVLFDGFLSLEWEENRSVANDEKTKFENHLFDIYKKQTTESPLKWLIALGLFETNISLSPSIEFWRHFSSGWIRLIRNNPECETKRELFAIDIEPADQEHFAEIVPPMIGGEYVTFDYFKHIWEKLHKTYTALAQSYRGFNRFTFSQSFIYSTPN